MPSLQWRLIIYTIFMAAILNASTTEDVKYDPWYFELCPFIGNVGDRYKINVLGKKAPRLGGCTVKQRSYKIDFWIGSLEFSDTHCRPIGSNFEHYGMDHYIYDCKNAWYAKPERGDHNGFVYVTLQDRSPHKPNVFKCAMYEQKEGINMRFAIAENNNCTGLKERLTQPINSNFSKNEEWMKGFTVLDFSPNIEMTFRSKRSPERTHKRNESISGPFKAAKWIKSVSEFIVSHLTVTEKSAYMKRDVSQCRFPDWTQGQWTNLKIKGGEARYEYAFYDEEENMDETDPDNEEVVNIENIAGRSLSRTIDDTTPSWRYRRFVHDEHTTTQRPTKTESIPPDSRVNKKIIYKNQEISLENLKNSREIYGEGQRNRRSILSNPSFTDDTTHPWRYRRFVNNDLTTAQHKINVSADVETDQNDDKLFKRQLKLDKALPTVNDSMHRKRRASQRDQQKQTKPKFMWRCSMSVDYDDNQTQATEIGAKFLTWGGRINQEPSVVIGNGLQNDKESLVDIGLDDSMTYSCLWIKPRGPNILEFSIIGTGLPTRNQDMASFARELCNNNNGSHDSQIRNREKIRPRQKMWITETRKNESEHVPFACPVSPGTVFYGVVPAPPQLYVASNTETPVKLADGIPFKSHGQLCAKLVSSADDCVNGVAGPVDRMKYTVSECVDQRTIVDEINKSSKNEIVFEERDYQCIGQWTEKKDMVNPLTGEKVVYFTYTYLKRVGPKGVNAAEFECFIATTIPNDSGENPETTSTLLLTEAPDRCSHHDDPFTSGMKLVGTKIIGENSCSGDPQQSQTVGNGDWFPLKPQQISTSENNGGKRHASHLVPIQGSASSEIFLKNGVSPSKEQQQKTPGSSLSENRGVDQSASTITMGYYLTISMIVVVFNHVLI